MSKNNTNIDINKVIESVKADFDVFLRDHGHCPNTMEHSDKSAWFAVYAFGGYATIDDIDEIKSDIVDGLGDKGVDFCRIDENTGKAFIIQSYLSEKWKDRAPPAHKATLLNAGMGWLLNPHDIDSVSNETFRGKSDELINAIKCKGISEIHILYVHNRLSSKAVDEEMAQVTRTTHSHIKSKHIRTVSKQLGIKEIYTLYKDKEKTILIDDEIPLPENIDCLRLENDEWGAAVVSVHCKWVVDLHKKYNEKLFNDNFRDYMGHAQRKGDINRDIKNTAVECPDKFWVFNNGITILVNDMKFSEDAKLVSVRGISIINGAQTTGALSSAYSEDLVDKSPKVLLRIVKVKCNDQHNNEELVDNIIRYNNTQNEIKPEDRRSKEPDQKKLAEGFKKYAILYIYRRSFSYSNKKTKSTLIKIAQLGKILCAFHVDMQIAHRNSKHIFDKYEVYKKTFPTEVSAAHCLVVYTLAKCIDKIKVHLKNRVSSKKATDNERQQYQILQYSISKLFLLHIIGKMMEDIYGNDVPDIFLIVPKENIQKKSVLCELTAAWEKFIYGIMPAICDFVEDYSEKNGIDNPNYEVPRDKNHTDAIAKEMVLRFRQNKGSALYHNSIKDLITLKSE